MRSRKIEKVLGTGIRNNHASLVTMLESKHIVEGTSGLKAMPFALPTNATAGDYEVEELDGTNDNDKYRQKAPVNLRG